MRAIRKGDLLIIVVLIIIGGISLAINRSTQERLPEGSKFVIEIEGKVEQEHSLAVDNSILIEQPVGFNRIEVADGRVRVAEADCPDQLCVNFGWIERAGQMIICLPHQLIVRVTDEAGDDLDLDGVTF